MTLSKARTFFFVCLQREEAYASKNSAVLPASVVPKWFHRDHCLN